VTHADLLDGTGNLLSRTIGHLYLLLCTLHTLSASATSLFFAVAVICLIRGVTCVLTPLLEFVLHVVDWAHIDLHQMKTIEYGANPNSKGMISQMRTNTATAFNLMILFSQRTPNLLDINMNT